MLRSGSPRSPILRSDSSPPSSLTNPCHQKPQIHSKILRRHLRDCLLARSQTLRSTRIEGPANQGFETSHVPPVEYILCSRGVPCPLCQGTGHLRRIEHGFFGEKNGLNSPYFEGKEIEIIRFRLQVLVCRQKYSEVPKFSTFLSLNFSQIWLHLWMITSSPTSSQN